jgi:hypothetical protein
MRNRAPATTANVRGCARSENNRDQRARVDPDPSDRFPNLIDRYPRAAAE